MIFLCALPTSYSYYIYTKRLAFWSCDSQSNCLLSFLLVILSKRPVLLCEQLPFTP
jgi:hypothetical protein